MYRNEPGQKLTTFAYDRTTQLAKIGDAANISVFQSIDFEPWQQIGDTTTEEDAVKAAGFYLVDLLKVETDGANLRFSATSSTANVIVICMPTIVNTELKSKTSYGPGCCGVAALQAQQQIELLQTLVDNLCPPRI